MNSPVLSLQNVTKNFPLANVLRDITFDIYAEDSVALLGESGSGKSTLLQISGLLDTPTHGNVFINGINTTLECDDKKTLLRRTNIGFVYQFHNLLQDFTVIENVMIPLLICGTKKSEAYALACEALNNVGLCNRLQRLPKMLSGGEQQRVAIARAIVHKPKIIIADEPTGNLDGKNSEIVFDLFLQLTKTYKTALLMATHNTKLANMLQKKFILSNGELNIKTSTI